VALSWLLPVYDSRPWLGEAVRSAIAECGPGDEVVVIDDGSHDRPEEVLPLDGRLRLLRQPHRGISAALEQGRRRARGRFLARLDADDVALPGRIAAQLPVLADPSVAAVGGRARLLGSAPEGMRRHLAWVNGLDDLHRELLVESPLFHPAVTLRAEAVEAVGGWREGDFPEDYDLWLRLVAAGWKLRSVEREVLALRDRPDRLTRVDPRYRRAAFTELKMEWLARQVLAGRQLKVVVWGAGRTGRPWIRWLLAREQRVVAVLDLRHGFTRQGVAVLPPEALAGLELDLLVVAVGARGARALIRERIATQRPELVEGRDWWAVA